MIEPLSFLSTFMTLATMALACVVLYFWSSSARGFFKDIKTLSAQQLFILGVVINFIGQFFDNGYWLIAWTLNDVKPTSALTDYFFDNGIFYNLFFRQTPGIAAAILHIVAALKFAGCNRCKITKIVVYCFGGALALTALLPVFRAVS